MAIKRYCLLILSASLLLAGCQTGPITPPLNGPLTATTVTSEGIDRKTLWKEIHAMAPKSHGPIDQTYYCPSTEEMHHLFPRLVHRYYPDKWDCDDIAQETLVLARRLHLKDGTNALCAGMIAYSTSPTNGHAAVIVRTSKGHWRVFDPASNQWSPVPPKKKIYWIQI
jgi:hypothetical protein